MIAPLKHTSEVRPPTAGGMGVIIRGKTPDLIGRKVKVDQVLKSKCNVHYIENGTKMEIQGLPLTSVHGLEDGGTDGVWEVSVKQPSQEQQQRLETMDSKVIRDVVHELFVEGVVECGVVIRRTPACRERKKSALLVSTEHSIRVAHDEGDD